MKRFIALLLFLIFSLNGCTAVLFAAPTDYEESISEEASEIHNGTDVKYESGKPESESDESEEYSAESFCGLEEESAAADSVGDGKAKADLSAIPVFSGDPHVVINDNIPHFTAEELTTVSYEYYSELDYLGRCGVTIASIGRDIMPTEDRGSIGSVKPTGWQTVKYDCVDGKYLYNRCHLIGYQLTGENANTRNLITGTRFMNTEGMLPFENMVADYIKETGNHVAYRVTPIFESKNLLASGVQMEAYSIEDNGEGICFNVYCYNAQPEIAIDYSNGDSEYVGLIPEEESREEVYEESSEYISEDESEEITYVLNTNSKKFHYPSCPSADKISDKNREETTKSREELIDEGYDPCGNCDP